MLQNFKHIAVVSVSTMGSRVLGLLRDVLIFAALGTSLWSSAFILAFTVPNLFRRLLGEGALTSAIIPVFSDVLEREGRNDSFRFFNSVLTRLFLILLVIVAVGILGIWCLDSMGWLAGRWVTGGALLMWLLPYMLFVCLTAIISAGLNLLGRFAAPALTPVLLNLAMIGALGAGMFLEETPARIVRWLCGGVLFGGVLQLLLPAVDFLRQGWRPRFEWANSPALQELWRLFLPGVVGAAILQVNILLSRVLAYSLEESAVAELYLSSRLMELPLGVFTIAVATVFFPLMARALSSEDHEGFALSFLQGMRLVVAISVPAGFGLMVLGEPIVETLFLWGAFNAADVLATLPLLTVYGIGLPFYSVATFATRGLHAAKDMKTPVRVAGVCLGVNLVAGLFLMQLWGAVGLALGNILSASVQSLLLWRSLAAAQTNLSFSSLQFAFAKILIAGVVMMAFCFGGWTIFDALDLQERLRGLLGVVVLIPSGVIVYFAMLALLRFEELDLLKKITLGRVMGRR